MRHLRQWLVRNWPLRKGRGLLAKALFPFGTSGRATVSRRYGTFVDAPIGKWPAGYADLFVHGDCETAEVRIWKSMLRPGDVVVDGGANLGFWSMIGSRLFGADRLALAFEPHPMTFRELGRNLAASRILNVLTFDCGLWDYFGSGAIDHFADWPSRAGGQIDPVPKS